VVAAASKATSGRLDLITATPLVGIGARHYSRGRGPDPYQKSRGAGSPIEER